MVSRDVIENIIKVAKECSTWIKPIDYGDKHEFVERNRFGLVRRECKVLRFVVYAASQDCVVGQEILIPDFELQAAIDRLSIEPEFSRHLSKCRLTASDVNRLVLSATWGQLDLELE